VAEAEIEVDLAAEEVHEEVPLPEAEVDSEAEEVRQSSFFILMAVAYAIDSIVMISRG